MNFIRNQNEGLVVHMDNLLIKYGILQNLIPKWYINQFAYNKDSLSRKVIKY